LSSLNWGGGGLYSPRGGVKISLDRNLVAYIRAQKIVCFTHILPFSAPVKMGGDVGSLNNKSQALKCRTVSTSDIVYFPTSLVSILADIS